MTKMRTLLIVLFVPSHQISLCLKTASSKLIGFLFSSGSSVTYLSKSKLISIEDWIPIFLFCFGCVLRQWRSDSTLRRRYHQCEKKKNAVLLRIISTYRKTLSHTCRKGEVCLLSWQKMKDSVKTTQLTGACRSSTDSFKFEAITSPFHFV